MKVNKITLTIMGLAVACLFASCKKENDNIYAGEGFRASIEQSGSNSKGARTYINPNWNQGTASLLWTAEDNILVANGNGDVLTYTLSDGADSNEGYFASDDEDETFLQPNYVAIYPAKSAEDVGNVIEGTTATFSLPATQIYKENSFAEKSMPMVAYTDKKNFQFKNVLGGICFPLEGDNLNVTRIVLTSNADEPLWGVCVTTISTSGGDPTSTVTNTSTGKNSITLDCSANGGVTLSSGSPTYFCMTLPPAKLASGFSIAVYDGETKLYEKSTSNNPNITRNAISKVNGSLTLVVENNAPEGAVDGVFSVGANKKVYFSQGNLQYIGSASTPYWKFADHQWDYFGSTTGQFSDAVNVDRDLFGWGTSGFDNTANDPYAVYFQPWSTESSFSVNQDFNYVGYGPSTNQNNPDLAGSNYDWGVYNDIHSGESTIPAGTYRTLTSDEWGYLIDSRPNHANLCGEGSVDGVNGFIVLPDVWTTPPAGLSFTAGSSAFVNAYTVDEWIQMETAGAVFLPVAWCRTGTMVANDISGLYHSATHYNERCSYYMFFVSGAFMAQCYEQHTLRFYGASVRLVIDESTQPVQIPAKSFSVAEGNYVWFSPGNLQYKSNETYPWRFAPHQYDCIGTWNTDNWVDHFGWGAWTGSNPNPTNDSFDNSDYDWDNGDFMQESFLADEAQRAYDWFTLSNTQWNYLFNAREDASNKWGCGTVANKTGCILLPDTWNGGSLNSNHNGYSDNVFSANDWLAWESNGAIFLPTTGVRQGSDFKYVDDDVNCWSSTPSSDNDACGIIVENNGYFGTFVIGKYYGQGVRLVRDAPAK